jgi:hypothetical protein
MVAQTCFAVIGVALLASGAGAQTPGAERPTREITVTTTRSVDLAPDHAVLYLGVTTRDPDAARAGEQHAGIAQRVRAALGALGFRAESLPTIGYTVRPEYDRDRNRPIGYSAQSRIQVRVHDLGRVGRVIDAALGAGANVVSGLSFESTRSDRARLDALARAVAAAREEAEAIARAAGGRLGALLEANTGEVGFIRGAREVMMRAQGEVETPIMPGTLEITATVTTRWEFIPNP